METLPFKDVEIEGQGFRLNLLGAVQGRQLFVRLAKTLGPTLQRLDMAEPASLLSSGAGAFLATLDERLFEDLCVVFGTASWILGPDGLGAQVIKVQGTLFAGKYMLLLEWLYANLAWNFPDFLGENGLVVKRLKAAQAKARARESAAPSGPASQTTSTGTSDEFLQTSVPA